MAVSDISLRLYDLPVSERTVMAGGTFLISDNLDESDALSVLRVPWRSGVLLGVPFKMQFTTILVVVSGRMRIRLRMEEREAREGDMMVIIEGSLGECVEISDDARLLMMGFSSEFPIMEGNMRPSAGMVDRMSDGPLVHLSETELRNVMALYDIMHSRLSDPGFPHWEVLASSCMRALLGYVSPHIEGSDEEGGIALTGKGAAYGRFLRLLDQYGGKSHRLEFYAEKLCMTPKYMSRIVKEASGRTAGEWIRLRLLMEAKVLLREGELTVQQISDRLDFPNQSFFGTFFRRNVGMTPGSYRRRKLQ